VMAAGLACEDLFWTPKEYPYRAEHFQEVLHKLAKALESRTHFDKGVYSEPIMRLMLYKYWLQTDHKETKWHLDRWLYESRMKFFDLEVSYMC
jgi:hypothetical protein